MGQGIGELNVGVTANTKRARKNIREFSRDLGAISSIGRGAAVGVGSVAAAGAALGIAVVVGKEFADITRQSFENLDKLGKSADKLGVGTKELAGMRLAAEETGVASNTLDMAIQRMVRRVSEAAIGIGEARGALQELGVDAKELSSLSPDKQFQAIATAMSGVNSQADKVRLAFKLFDSEGVALVNTLALGKEGLNEAQAAAEKLGIALDRDAIKRVEKANNAIGRMGKAWEGVGNELAITFAPAVEYTADVAQEFFRGIQHLPENMGLVSSAAREAASAIDEKAAAAERAAKNAEIQANAEKKIYEAYKKELALHREREQLARKGRAGVEFDKNVKRFGRKRAQDISDARGRADDAEAIKAEQQRLEELRNRNKNFGKSEFDLERDRIKNQSMLGREDRAEALKLLDEIERKERAVIAEKKREREKEAAERKAMLEQERLYKKQQQEKEKEHQRQVSEIAQARSQIGTAGALDARSAEGFRQLRSSVNKGYQDKMLEKAREQVAEQVRLREAFEELFAGATTIEVAEIGG